MSTTSRAARVRSVLAGAILALGPLVAPATGQPIDCVIVPPGAQVEEDGPVGCETSPPRWQVIQCGVPFVGQVCNSFGQRDTDWVMFTLLEPATVTVTCRAELEVSFGFVGDANGPLPVGPDWCGAVSQLNPFTTVPPGCGPQTITSALQPGSYIVSLGTLFAPTPPPPCPDTNGNQYLLEITATGECSGDCNGNGVIDSVEIAAAPALDCYDPAVTGSPHTIGGPDGRLDACQCQGDWNRDAAVNSSDISVFLTSWLAGLGGGADLDCSGQVNSSDISTFLGVWLDNAAGVPEWSGCP